MTKNKIYSLITIVVIAIIGIGLFISCKEDENTQLYNNKSVVQEPTIDLKLINEINNDSSFWIGYGTFHDELLWTSNNVYQGSIYYNFKSFGELHLTRISENVFELYDPFKETTSLLENINLSDDEMSMTADYIVDNVNYKMIYKDNLNKAGIFDFPIGEKIVLSDNMSDTKVAPLLIWKAIYYASCVISVAVFNYCNEEIEKGRVVCSKKGCDSKVVAGCKVECINCPPPPVNNPK